MDPVLLAAAVHYNMSSLWLGPTLNQGIAQLVGNGEDAISEPYRHLFKQPER